MGVTSPLPPSKGEMRRTNIHEQYDVGTGGRLGRKHPPAPLQRATIHEQYDVGTGGRLGSNIPPAPFKGRAVTKFCKLF